jgi:tetratricopeptide (TPR) repeat protein
MSKQLIILILVLFAHDAGASLPVDTALNNLQVKLRITKADTNRVKLLQRIGEFYLFKPGEEKADLDSAFHYLNQALNLTMALHQPKFTYDILKYIGNTYVEAGELKKGTDYFMQSIQYYHYNSLFALEADSWGWLGDMYYNNGKNDHISERLIFYARAKNIYLQLHDRKNATLVILQMASTLMSRGDVNGGIKTLTDLTTQYHNEKDTLSEADTWFYLARALIPYDLQYLSLRGQAYVNAYNLYMALYKYVDAANMLNAAARIHVTKGLYKQAEYEFLTAIKLYKHYDTEYLPEAYFWLADLYSVTSDLDKEIASRLKGIESIRGAAKENLLYYSNLAIDYHAAGIKIKSKQYLQKAMSIAMAKGDTTGYVFFLHMFIDDMVDDGNAKQALALLNHKLADLKYLKGPEKVDIADAVGNCYVALKQYEKARPYIETLKGVVKNSSTVKAYAEMANWDYCYFKIINYYILSADFKTAKYYLSNAEKLPQSVISVYTKSNNIKP